MASSKSVALEELYSLKFKALWQQMRSEHFSFWMICLYLFMEYVRPQGIFPAIDFFPWTRLFLVLSLLSLWADRSKQWVKDPCNKWMFTFQILILISSFCAEYPDISWKYFMDFFGWFVIYFLIINTVTTRKRFFIFLLIFLVCCAKISIGCAKNWALRGFSFADWGLSGPPGYFQNSGELAILMLSFAPVAYLLTISIKPYLSRLQYLVLLVVPLSAVMTIIGASSRGAQIALIFQFYYVFLKGSLSIKKLIVVGVILISAFMLVPDEQKQRFTEAGQDTTSKQRLLYWKRGEQMIMEHPVLGVGYFNFIPYFNQHYSQDLIYFKHAELPHNIFIQVGTDVGLLGLFVYAMLIYRGLRTASIIRTVSQKTDPLSAAMAKGFGAGLWGFLFAGQFVTVAYYPFMWITLAFLVSLKRITSKDTKYHKNGSVVAE